MVAVLGQPTQGMMAGSLFKNRLINGGFSVAQRGATLGVSTTGTTSNGSAVVTGIPSTTNIRTGMAVYSAGGQVPTGRTVASVDSATQITLSSGTSVTAGTDQAIVFGLADNTYGLDRWRLLTENEAGAILNQETTTVPTGVKYAARATVTTNNNGKFGLWQVIEGINCRDFRSKNVVVSGQVRIDAAESITDVRVGIVEFTGTEDSVSGDPISTWGAALTNPTLAANYAFLNTPAALTLSAGGYASFSIPATCGASGTNYAVFVWCDDRTTTAGHFLYVANVQIEIADSASGVATPFEVRGIGAETLLCQRYAYIVTASAGGLICSGLQCISTTICFGGFQFPATMRTNPTGTYSAVGQFELRDKDNAAKTVTGLTVAGTVYMSNLTVTVASGLVAGNATLLFGLQAGSQCFVSWSAEL